MKLTVATLWLTSGRNRRDLSSAARVQEVDAARAAAPPPKDAARYGTLTRSRITGRPVLRWVPHDQIPGRELIYFPGGGFVHPLVAEHWWSIRRIMQSTRAAVTIAPYPLTSEHTYSDARTFVDAVYDEVSGRAGTRELFLAGDSAGGNVALTLALRLRDDNRQGVDGLVLLSPWLDAALRHPDAWTRQNRDPTLRCAGLRAAGEWWAGPLGLDHPQISPIRADLRGLPPTVIFQGERDIFLADSVEFSRRARAAGSPVRLVTAADGFHVYVGAYWTREARDAYRLIGRFADAPDRITRA